MSAVLRKGLPAIASVKAGNANAAVAKWLLGCAGVVGGIVHVGGVTRLTKSGLSMTDWKPLGSLPPITPDEWNIEFERYKQFPEFEQRKSMTIEEFQFIYYWEWGHRMLGRFVGVCFAAPFAYFAVRKKIPQGYYPRMFTLLTMGGTQGLVGWWMVKSGLGEDRRGDRNEIRVSPYRLASHLSMAFATYSLLFWTGLDLLHPASRLKAVASDLMANNAKYLKNARMLRTGSIGVTALTALTAASGAFVAGNDAGRAFNTFPLMDDQWMPLSEMVDETLQPLYRNLFENTATVQWNHRVLAMSTAASIFGLAGVGVLNPSFRRVLTPQATKALVAMGVTAAGQVTLGISTLLMYVPVPLAAAHQLGSLVLLSTGLYTVHSFRYVSPVVLRSLGTNTAKAAVGNGRAGVAVAAKALR